jgi:hypothetical protein
VVVALVALPVLAPFAPGGELPQMPRPTMDRIARNRRWNSQKGPRQLSLLPILLPQPELQYSVSIA